MTTITTTVELQRLDEILATIRARLACDDMSYKHGVIIGYIISVFEQLRSQALFEQAPSRQRPAASIAAIPLYYPEPVLTLFIEEEQLLLNQGAETNRAQRYRSSSCVGDWLIEPRKPN